MFNKSVTILTGLERLMLENSAFDFRTRYPHLFIAKIARMYGLNAEHRTTVVKAAYYMGTDAYRTWAPLKHVPAAIALACVELAGRLYDANVMEIEDSRDYDGNGRFPDVNRPMVMGKLDPMGRF
jgi:CTD kinase subunit beta